MAVESQLQLLLLPTHRPMPVPLQPQVQSDQGAARSPVAAASQRTRRQIALRAVYFGFTTADYAQSIVTGRTEFGDVMIEVNAGETRVTNVPLVDPNPPGEEMPFAFDNQRTLWLRIKAQDAHILFNGAKLNYRRMRVAV